MSSRSYTVNRIDKKTVFGADLRCSCGGIAVDVDPEYMLASDLPRMSCSGIVPFVTIDVEWHCSNGHLNFFRWIRDTETT